LIDRRHVGSPGWLTGISLVCYKGQNQQEKVY
jgi:hypothetical protein